MKTLVTGGAGFIGSHLVERLVDDGHHVDVVDDLSTGSLANLAAARSGRTGRLRIHQLDVRDPGVTELMARRRPEVVFHLAWRDDGTGATDQVVTDAEVNVIGSLNVLEGARRAGSRKVVFASTATVLYQAPTPSDLPIREQHLQRPLTPHGVAEKVVVDYLVAYREMHAIEFTALVLANVYGPRQRTGVTAVFIDQLRAGERRTIHGDGTQTRDFVFVNDVVEAFVRAADRGSGLVANIGTGTETSVNELHAALCATAQRPLETAKWPARSGEVGRFALDAGRARIHLGWVPWTSLDDGLSQVLEHSGVTVVNR